MREGVIVVVAGFERGWFGRSLGPESLSILISWWLSRRRKFLKGLGVVGLDTSTSAACFRSCASCGEGFMLPSEARMLVVRCLYSWAN